MKDTRKRKIIHQKCKIEEENQEFYQLLDIIKSRIQQFQQIFKTCENNQIKFLMNTRQIIETLK
jgi:hypothetical protein